MAMQVFQGKLSKKKKKTQKPFFYCFSFQDWVSLDLCWESAVGEGLSKALYAELMIYLLIPMAVPHCPGESNFVVTAQRQSQLGF